jgi:hypothetical protein
MEKMENVCKMFQIQFRMMFGSKHRYQKEYEEALDAVGERGHWLYLYDSLEGPKADQVCEALKKWVEANQELHSIQLLDNKWEQLDNKWAQLWMNEKRLERELHMLIYGEYDI